MPPENQFPPSLSRKAITIKGKVREGEEAFAVYRQLTLDENGLVDSEDTGLISCWSCGHSISQESLGGVCHSCSGVLDERCAEEYRCSECGRLCCVDDSLRIGEKRLCNKDGRAALMKPIIMGLVLFIVAAISFAMCN